MSNVQYARNCQLNVQQDTSTTHIPRILCLQNMCIMKLLHIDLNGYIKKVMRWLRSILLFFYHVIAFISLMDQGVCYFESMGSFYNVSTIV